MRRLTEDEFDDLQAVIRAFCEDAGVRYKQFAKNVGEIAYKSALSAGASYADATTQRENAKEIVNKFLTSPQNGGINALVGACLAALTETTDAQRAGSLEEFRAFAEAFAAGPDYRRTDGITPFVAECRKSLSSGRPRNGTSRQAGAPVSRRRISRIYRLAATEFDAHDHDVNFMDSRIGNSRYVCIRRSSKETDKLVVHGLRFSPHEDDPEAYYFSEKYYVKRSDDIQIGRKSQGLCFVEGAYLSAFSRPDNNAAAFTYLHIKIPMFMSVDKTSYMDQFEGMISTSNTAGQRFWAPTLGFRCIDKSDKHTKLGIYSESEILSVFSDSQRDVIRRWLSDARFSLQFL